MSGALEGLQPEELAALAAQLDDEDLAAALSVGREAILDEVFRRMPERFARERAGDLDAVVEWRIPDRPDGGEDRFQVVIRDGRCTAERDGAEKPRVVYTLGAVDFVKLVSGSVAGPRLFLFGRLKVRGDLFLAARMPRLFRIPGGGTTG
jgi:putative sterol carrier protein